MAETDRESGMKGIVKSIEAAETRPLRQIVLRPEEPPEHNIYPGDDGGADYHAGAFVDGILVGVTPIFPEPMPGSDLPDAWRLRGMVVLLEYQRRGYGQALLRACLAHIVEQGGSLLWCNSRLEAVPFYEVNGFQLQGEPFQPPGQPVHWRMWIDLKKVDESVF